MPAITRNVSAPITLRLRAVFAAALASLFALGCGEDLGPIDPSLDPMGVLRVEVTPRIDTLRVLASVGSPLQLRAAVISRTLRPIEGARVIWLTENAEVASVDANGVVRATGVGTTRIIASAGKQGFAEITVLPLVSSVRVASPASEIFPSDSIQLTATALDARDLPLPDISFTWRSSDPTVATVNENGIVAAREPGSTIISASLDGGLPFGEFVVTVRESRFLSATAGGDLSCGVSTLGRLHCWGRGDYGQLASTADSVCSDETEFVGRNDNFRRCSLAPKRAAGPRLTFRTALAGGNFACGLTTSRELYCWGADDYGQLGRGRIAGNQFEPRLASAGSTRFDSLTVGRRHACALTSAGEAYCWGEDSTGQLGDQRNANSSTPIPVFSVLRFRSISAGGHHTCGIATSGLAYCWGANQRGQLGTGAIGAPVNQPALPVEGGPYTAISAGFEHTCAITTAGRVRCWGDNTRGQLGLGSASLDAVPTPSEIASALSFTMVSAGGDRDTLPRLQPNTSHTCALTTTGTPYCWGDNTWRQSGVINASLDVVPTPTAIDVVQSGSFTTVSTGSRHSCGFSTAGEVWCWGSNVFGALGNGLQAAGRHTPQPVLRPR
jgi:alpha-tubulin suppressor-like RCC1 family protein